MPVVPVVSLWPLATWFVRHCANGMVIEITCKRTGTISVGLYPSLHAVLSKHNSHAHWPYCVCWQRFDGTTCRHIPNDRDIQRPL